MILKDIGFEVLRTAAKKPVSTTLVFGLALVGTFRENIINKIAEENAGASLSEMQVGLSQKMEEILPGKIEEYKKLGKSTEGDLYCSYYTTRASIVIAQGNVDNSLRVNINNSTKVGRPMISYHLDYREANSLVPREAGYLYSTSAYNEQTIDDRGQIGGTVLMKDGEPFGEERPTMDPEVVRAEIQNVLGINAPEEFVENLIVDFFYTASKSNEGFRCWIDSSFNAQSLVPKAEENSHDPKNLAGAFTVVFEDGSRIKMPESPDRTINALSDSKINEYYQAFYDEAGDLKIGLTFVDGEPFNDFAYGEFKMRAEKVKARYDNKQESVATDQDMQCKRILNLVSGPTPTGSGLPSDQECMERLGLNDSDVIETGVLTASATEIIQETDQSLPEIAIPNNAFVTEDNLYTGSYSIVENPDGTETRTYIDTGATQTVPSPSQ